VTATGMLLHIYTLLTAANENSGHVEIELIDETIQFKSYSAI
jgi:hypothetical protein